MKELEGLEEEALDDRLRGAENVPIHIPEGARADSGYRASTATALRADQLLEQHVAVEDDEEAALRQLQAEMAM